MSVTSDEIRKSFQESDDLRDKGLTVPENMERFCDICYGQNPEWQVLDVYRRNDLSGQKLPVIISVHGGAWVYGDKERYQYYCMDLAERGFAVVNFTYRLAPEFQFPAPIEDTNLVVQWVFDNAKEYGMDADHIFMVGDSAGADALGIYCNICTNPEIRMTYAELGIHAPSHFIPEAVAFNSGAYEVKVNRSHPDQNTLLMADYLPNGGDERELDLIAVAPHVTGGFPPVYLMTAEDDFLKPQVPLMVNALLAANVPFTFHYFRAQNPPQGSRMPEVPTPYKLGHVFHLNIREANAIVCNDEECGFFREFL